MNLKINLRLSSWIAVGISKSLQHIHTKCILLFLDFGIDGRFDW